MYEAFVTNNMFYSCVLAYVLGVVIEITVKPKAIKYTTGVICYDALISTLNDMDIDIGSKQKLRAYYLRIYLGK